MLNSGRMLCAAALLGVAVSSFSQAASAAPFADLSLKQSAPNAVETVRWGGRGGFGRGGFGRGGFGRGRGWGWGVGGFAAGALIGGALAAPYYYGPGPYYYPGPYYPAPAYYDGPEGEGREALAYCMQRFKSFDPRTGTYMGNDGHRHACP